MYEDLIRKLRTESPCTDKGTLETMDPCMGSAYSELAHHLESYVDLEEQAKKNNIVMNRIINFIKDGL